MNKYLPILNWLPQIKNTWQDDLVAGLSVSVIAIPQAVAFAFIAGLPPIYGLYAAIIIPIVTAIFGSSYHLISGPTTSVSILVFASLSKLVGIEAGSVAYQESFIALCLALTFMAGFIQFLMGVFKWANIVNFVSHTVIVGFTAGAGILIAFKQLHFVFGLPIPKGSSLIEIIQYIVMHFADINWSVFLVAILTLLSALLFKRISFIKKLYMILAMLVGSIAAYFLGMESAGISMVGKISEGLPSFQFPHFTIETIKMLGSSALVLALLGTVEAVAIAKSVALQTNQKINHNQEFVAQGLANMVSSMFSGYMGTGSFTRTGLNYQTGAKTPLTALISAFVLLFVVLFGARFTEFLPHAAMGGIILLVGYNLIDFSHIKRIFKSSQKETVVFLATFLSVLFLSLELALLVGVVVSLLFYLYKTSNVYIKQLGLTPENKFVNTERPVAYKTIPNLHMMRIDGSIYFGTIERLSNHFLHLYEEGHRNILILAQGINFIDLAGAEWLSREMKKFQQAGGKIVVVGAKLRSQEILKKGGFFDEIDEANFFDDKNEALDYIQKAIKQ